MTLRVAVLSGLLLSSPALAASKAAVTVYTRDLAFVRETRTLELRSARDTVRLRDVPDRIDVTSVRLSPEKGRVTRLAYRFDVASGDGVIEAARGARVRAALRDNRTVEGVLVGSDPAWLMVRTDDGGLESIARAALEQLRFAPPPADLAFAPSVEAVIEGGSGRTSAELAYLTGGLSWSAEHSVVRTSETSAQWTTTVSVENTSGQSFEVPKLALVAGEPRREGPVAPPMPMAGRAMEMSMVAEKADFAQQSFADYHLYTLDRPALLRDRETQSLVMLETRSVQVTPRYLYRGGGSGVASQMIITNSKSGGLGVPLPEGRVRFYDRDAAGDRHFTGESRIRHTAEDEKLTLDVGTAFDLVAERRELLNRRISDREREYQIEIKLRNRKSNGVTIVVEEPVAGDHEVTQKSHPFTRKDAGTLQFDLAVGAGKEVVLTYTVRVRW